VFNYNGNVGGISSLFKYLTNNPESNDAKPAEFKTYSWKITETS